MPTLWHRFYYNGSKSRDLSNNQQTSAMQRHKLYLSKCACSCSYITDAENLPAQLCPWSAVQWN